MDRVWGVIGSYGDAEMADKVKHNAIHKLVWAIKALRQAEELITQPSAIDHIRHASKLVWDAGEELGIDITKQLRKTEATG